MFFPLFLFFFDKPTGESYLNDNLKTIRSILTRNLSAYHSNWALKVQFKCAHLSADRCSVELYFFLLYVRCLPMDFYDLRRIFLSLLALYVCACDY